LLHSQQGEKARAVAMLGLSADCHRLLSTNNTPSHNDGSEHSCACLSQVWLSNMIQTLMHGRVMHQRQAQPCVQICMRRIYQCHGWQSLTGLSPLEVCVCFDVHKHFLLQVLPVPLQSLPEVVPVRLSFALRLSCLPLTGLI